MHQVMHCMLHTCGACDMSSVRLQTNDRVYGTVYDRCDKIMYERRISREWVERVVLRVILAGISNVHVIPYQAIRRLAAAAQETDHE